jgi:hypothetical protein
MVSTTRNHRGEKGIVSLFVVIFAALLISTVTIAFTRMMIIAQQQATASDLSKSALDSAYAGIEDAKRLTGRYISECFDANYTFISSQNCDEMQDALNRNQCNTIQEAGLAGSSDDQEVNLESTVGARSMDQAYTCVKVDLFPKEYIGTLMQNTPQIIPLKVEGNQKINSIKIEWFSKQDIVSSNPSASVKLPDLTSDKLPTLESWDNPSRNEYTPPVLRAQLIQHPNSFKLSDFDIGQSGKMNSGTVFLYPSAAGFDSDSVNFGFAVDPRPTSIDSVPVDESALQAIRCDTSAQFICPVTMNIPDPISSGGASYTYYLLLSQNYSPRSSFKISIDGGSKSFFFVQAAVDSTGRANDLFRRLNVRLNLYPSIMAMPQASIDSVKSICKPKPNATSC